MRNKFKGKLNTVPAKTGEFRDRKAHAKQVNSKRENQNESVIIGDNFEDFKTLLESSQ